jgi:hypothetical protein
MQFPAGRVGAHDTSYDWLMGHRLIELAEWLAALSLHCLLMARCETYGLTRHIIGT